MEDLSTALFYDTVPDTWVARAYPSMMGLAAWYADLLQRIRVSHRTPEPPGTFVPWPQSPRQPAGLMQVGRPDSVPQTSDFLRRGRMLRAPSGGPSLYTAKARAKAASVPQVTV